MWYTLAKGYVWVLIGVVLGLVIGWLLRSVSARRQVARARAHHVDGAELERLRSRVAQLEAAAAERDRLAAELAVRPIRLETPSTEASDDRVEAELVLGRPIVRDDLTVVSGITPEIAELCRRIGVRSWADLAATEPSLLRTMLVDAGPDHRDVDPVTWPRQAQLLVAGRWAEFAAQRSER